MVMLDGVVVRSYGSSISDGASRIVDRRRGRIGGVYKSVYSIRLDLSYEGDVMVNCGVEGR